MAQISRKSFVAVVIVFHILYCYSIFDTYFVSPIVSGMRSYQVEAVDAPAKRLVLFVGDGLRADKAFQSYPDPSPNRPNNTDALKPRPLAPFLRSRVLEHGTFGVSHTRMPTESRPGHVALIAGLYEDVSAVTTGWSLNPVNFDSVFNQSRHTWSWGSPDILPMFQKGAVPGRVDADSYPPTFEDFSGDALELDLWVFNKVKGLFASAKQDPALDRALREDKTVFFLHLLGLDSNGHTNRPYSNEYLHNIQIVDQGAKEISELIDNFYGDGRTAYVFTADHGMSDWGSHGDGHPDNTRTPLVAWGSGVAKPKTVAGGVAPGHEDNFSGDWNLDHVQRNDVAQADVAALMAYLVGIPFPVNSVGVLPLNYIAGDQRTKAQAMLTNAQEILEMYHVKEEQKRSREVRYKTYWAFGQEQSTPQERLAKIQLEISEGRYEIAVAESQQLIAHGLEGLRYLQTYDWLFLRTLVTAGYLGYIAFALTTVIDLHVVRQNVEPSRTAASVLFFSAAFVGICSLLYVKQAPWTYYAYAIFPFAFWEEVVARKESLRLGLSSLFSQVHTSKGYFAVAIKALAFISLLEALVQSYFHREIYTVCYLLATCWPFFYGTKFVSRNAVLITTWVLSCLVMSTFTLLPAIKTEDMTLILAGGSLMTAVGVLYLLFEYSITTSSETMPSASAHRPKNLISRSIIGAQVGLVILAMLVTKTSVTSLQARQGLPLGAQITGWLVLILSFCIPFLHSAQPSGHYLHRLVVIFLAFAPTFIILTISYEGLFYFAFSITMLTWVRMEHYIYKFTTASGTDGTLQQPSDLATPPISAARTRTAALEKGDFRSLTLADARISLFFLFLLQSAFFSTGNIASLSSFSLDAVFRLIPVFDPFSQAALLMLKLMLPFAVISANLGILNKRLGVAPSAIFMVVMAISDVMTMTFFYMVKDEGSWLDIGTTISHFCIASLLCVFVAGLELVSEVFVSGVIFHDQRQGQQPQGNAASVNGNGHKRNRH